LSKRYIDPKLNSHIAYKEEKNIIGTVRYISIGNHMGIENSRRDDLESIGYMLIYFLKGNLPWEGINGNNRQEKYQKIAEKKLGTSSEELCKDIPI